MSFHVLVVQRYWLKPSIDILDCISIHELADLVRVCG